MNRADTLEYNKAKIYSLLCGQFTEASQQGLCRNEAFEDNDIILYDRWILKQIKVTNQGIKEEKHLNP